MDIQKVATAAVGGWSVDVIVKTLLIYVITGTAVSDLLMLHTVPVVIAAGAFILVLRLFLA